MDGRLLVKKSVFQKIRDYTQIGPVYYFQAFADYFLVWRTKIALVLGASHLHVAFESRAHDFLAGF